MRLDESTSDMLPKEPSADDIQDIKRLQLTVQRSIRQQEKSKKD